MRILSIETSCDETGIAIVDAEGDGAGATFRILANGTLSQIAIHEKYGGVFPTLAKREHSRTLVPLLIRVLSDAGLYARTSRHVIEHPLREEFTHILEREPELYSAFVSEIPYIDPPKFDAIAVTTGPGLEPALWVGINFARALSMVWKIPVIPVNHMEGHILSSLLSGASGEVTLPSLEFPAIALLISGGHTELILMKDWLSHEVVGETRDDAVGEAFDKVARILGLPYPGGPEISRIAENGSPGIYPLPRPMLHSGDLNFSFSGIKTAVLYLVRSLGELDDAHKANIAREFEEAIVEVLIAKTKRAIETFGAKCVILGGGVSANTRIRTRFTEEIGPIVGPGMLHIPDRTLSTDNALMIAIAGYVERKHATTRVAELTAEGGLRLD
jgi:N6-L-threonylcarbamoyladenine synthase